MTILDRQESPDGRHVTLSFRCPGCESWHSYPVLNPGRIEWQWNGSMERPTFTPSLLNTQPDYRPEYRCHLFVTDGQIQYCGDCSHALAGQTVPMVEL